MGLFQHPHLTRGIVKTARGAFVVSRGVVDVPDELGESLGWQPAEAAGDPPTTVSRSSLPARGGSDQRGTSGESYPLTNIAHAGREQPIVHGARHRSPADNTRQMTGAHPSAARRRRERS
jgi:hypothetical protein